MRVPDIAEVIAWLETQAPPGLAEGWDNTGLLLGTPKQSASRVMTCLTASTNVVEEAIEDQVQLVISHHPLPFKPVASVTTATATGDLLWRLARAGVSLYSPHTRWDSASNGINAQLASMLQLVDVHPLIPAIDETLKGSGAGRFGSLCNPISARQVGVELKQNLPEARLRGVLLDQHVQRVAIACGSGASLLEAAIRQGCDCFVTGEASYHSCLEAEAAGVSLVLIGHYASERFAMVELASLLKHEFPRLHVFASQKEHDPVSE